MSASVLPFLVLISGIKSARYFNWQVLEKKSEEYQHILDYVKNTHAATHQQYELEVLEVREFVQLGSTNYR